MASQGSRSKPTLLAAEEETAGAVGDSLLNPNSNPNPTRSSLNLVDIENISEALWEQGVVPPAIDFSDMEQPRCCPPKCSGKFSEEDIAKITHLVKEELEESHLQKSREAELECLDDGDDDVDDDDDEDILENNNETEETECVCPDDECEKVLDSQFSDLDLDKNDKSEDEDEIAYLISDKEEEEQSEDVDLDPEDLRSEKVKSELSGDEGEVALVDDDDDGAEVKSTSQRSQMSGTGTGTDQDVESGACGDMNFHELDVSPSRISGLKAGLKTLKIKMCSCFNTKKCLHNQNSSHNLYGNDNN